MADDRVSQIAGPFGRVRKLAKLPFRKKRQIDIIGYNAMLSAETKRLRSLSQDADDRFKIVDRTLARRLSDEAIVIAIEKLPSMFGHHLFVRGILLGEQNRRMRVRERRVLYVSIITMILAAATLIVSWPS